MARLTGLVLIILGILMILGKFAFKSIFDKLPYLSTLNTAYIIITGLVLVILGYLLMKRKRLLKPGTEMPIYKGNKVIGFRRV